jgi:mRNA interferase MazF
VSGRPPVQARLIVRRGEVYEGRLDPGTEGSEQAGVRPVVIVSRDAINANSRVVLGVPCTTYRGRREPYPSQALLYAPDGGLTVDSIALGEQLRVLAKTRLLYRRGMLSPAGLARVDRALLIALDLYRPT